VGQVLDGDANVLGEVALFDQDFDELVVGVQIEGKGSLRCLGRHFESVLLPDEVVNGFAF
jgi:hypothetical protein